MTARKAAITKLRQMPEPLAQQVNNFIDFLLEQHELGDGWFRESGSLTEAGMDEYAENLSDYEQSLELAELNAAYSGMPTPEE